MNPATDSFDQPTQVGKKGGKKLTRQQKTWIYAGLGGAAALAGGSAFAWGMDQNGNANENHPKTEPVSATDHGVNEPKPSAETPADSTPTTPAHETVNPQASPAPTSETTHSTPTTEPANSSEPMVATHTSDSMTFEDAFKTARQEVGPGGYFEWHGHFYNTYYKEEWNALSTQERQEYTATVYGDDPSTTDQHASHGTTASYDTNQPDVKVGEYEGHAVGLGDTDHDGDAEVIVIDGTVGAVDKDNDGMMETRVQLDPNTHEVIAQTPLATPFQAPQMSALTAATAEPTPTATHNNQMEVHTVEFQGHDVILGDTDHDGDAEVLIIDGKAGVVDKDNDGVMETQVQLDPNTHEVVAQGPMTEVYHAPSMQAFDAPQSQNQYTATSAEPSQEVDVVKTTVDGHEVALADGNHDGYVDVMVADNGVGAMDQDGDHKFETAIQVDLTTGDIVASAPLDHTYDAPAMENYSAPDHTEQPTEVAHDFDNHADVSDWVA